MPNPTVVFETNHGTIEIELFEDKQPLTAGNFRKLVEQGFYDGTRFHRVIGPSKSPPDGFMLQGGDPLTKDASKKARWGTGGPGYTIKDEFHRTLRHDKPGMLSMANAGPNTGGSQFFLTLGATPWLDGKHAIFGHVKKGMEVVRTIGDVPTDARDGPKADVVITKARVQGA
jgi:peptidyl-prolyl cis-trans isomerase A (cyclophilin A)